jgi:hypothetical protein
MLSPLASLPLVFVSKNTTLKQYRKKENLFFNRHAVSSYKGRTVALNNDRKNTLLLNAFPNAASASETPLLWMCSLH